MGSQLTWRMLGEMHHMMAATLVRDWLLRNRNISWTEDMSNNRDNRDNRDNREPCPHLERVSVVGVPVLPAHGVHPDWVVLPMVQVSPQLAIFSDLISTSTTPDRAACVPGYGGALARPS